MSTDTITIGTRGSLLAMAQTKLIAELLTRAHPGLSVQLRKIVTRGDRQQKQALPQIGGKGLFTAELEAALLDGSIDLAVHSAKDLPTVVPEGLVLAATPTREDPRDVLISRGGRRLADLPPGAVLGTSSLRRQAQIRRQRPDLTFAVIRGNIDTRIRKVLKEAQCEATVLAMAGLIRTNLTEAVSGIFEFETMLPAAGQGALALQTRADDNRLRLRLKRIHDEPTYAALLCERRVIHDLQGGCQAPIGVNARIEANHLVCRAIVASTDGSRYARVTLNGSPDDPEALGAGVAERLRADGAEGILRECRDLPTP